MSSVRLPSPGAHVVSRAYGTTADVTRKRSTHIPLGPANERTYCGKKVVEVDCINLVKDAIDDATCKTCQRSDDRRTREEYKKSDEYKKQLELDTKTERYSAEWYEEQRRKGARIRSGMEKQ